MSVLGRVHTYVCARVRAEMFKKIYKSYSLNISNYKFLKTYNFKIFSNFSGTLSVCI